MPELNFTVSDDVYAAVLAFSLKYQSIRDGLKQIHPSPGILVMFNELFVAPAVNDVPSSALVAAQAALDSARGDVNAIIYGGTTDYAFQFHVHASTPASIANGTNGTTAFSVSILDPAYSGLVTLALLDPNSQGITGSFSPPTFIATGAGTLTIDVPSGVPANLYDLAVRGTDLDDITHQFIITLQVT